VTVTPSERPAFRITAPVVGYTGDGPGGLPFVDGIAETDDPAVIGYCQGAGYGVECLDATAPPEPEPEPEPNAPQATPAGRSRTRKKNEDQEVTADASN
jgi:hypothetical protein